MKKLREAVKQALGERAPVLVAGGWWAAIEAAEIIMREPQYRKRAITSQELVKRLKADWEARW